MSQGIGRAAPGANGARVVASNHKKSLVVLRQSAGCSGEPAACACDYIDRRSAVLEKIFWCRLPDKLGVRWTNVAGPILPERDCSILASAGARARTARARGFPPRTGPDFAQ